MTNETWRYPENRIDGEDYNLKENEVYGTLNNQQESKETKEENSKKLESLWFTLREEDIEEINNMKIDFSYINQLIEWWVLNPKSDTWRKIADSQLQSIQENFTTLNELHGIWLKMDVWILWDLWDVKRDEEQVQKLIDNKITVSDAKWLNKNASYNFPRWKIQRFKDIWYNLDEYDVENLVKNSPYIDFDNLVKITKILWRNILYKYIVNESDDTLPWLWWCNEMDFYDYAWIQWLINNHISIDDEDLYLFMRDKVNKENFQLFIDNNIPLNAENSSLIKYIQEETLNPYVLYHWYQKTHPEKDDIWSIVNKKYKNREQSFTITEFINAYKDLDQYFQNQNPSS